jgi:hypothetical protein
MIILLRVFNLFWGFKLFRSGERHQLSGQRPLGCIRVCSGVLLGQGGARLPAPSHGSVFVTIRACTLHTSFAEAKNGVVPGGTPELYEGSRLGGVTTMTRDLGNY